tara:strand:- start:4721 stop:5413 length:693 start_codon:yes stop_codon:yes gene_type:complete
MKLLIISAGPGLKQIRETHGHAVDWITSLVRSPNVNINVNNIYDGEDFNSSDYDAWIITGSAFSVLDNSKWINLLKNKIIEGYKKNIPIMGICFGHQIICEALGGKVNRNHLGWELGSYKIKFNSSVNSFDIFKNIDFNDFFYFSHEDIVTQLPEKAVKIASNKMGLQAFVIDNRIFGVQFHPEFNKEIMEMYIKIRYEKGIINNLVKVNKSKTSHKIIANFIKFCEERK